MLIDLNMNPSPQDGFIVAQDRSFLKPRWSGKSGTSQIFSVEHAKASAALAASFKSSWGKRGFVEGRLRSHILERRLWPATGICPLFSIDRPCARRGEFDQMAVRVSKVEAPASGFPRAFLFYRDSSRLEPSLPVAQFRRWNSERDV